MYRVLSFDARLELLVVIRLLSAPLPPPLTQFVSYSDVLQKYTIVVLDAVDSGSQLAIFLRFFLIVV